MAIITISRQFGSQGTWIAQKLAEVLSYSILDKETLLPMMAEQGITDIEKYDEKKPKFWDSIVMDRFMYIHALQTVVYKFARNDNCIIVGRGGQFLLGRVPGILKVSVVAPRELRIQRLQARLSCSRGEAEMQVRHNDENRQGFHHFFFDIDCDLPELYDLVINTAALSVERAVELIQDALFAEEIAACRDAAVHKLDDFCLGQEVMKNIRCNKRISSPYLDASVEDGVVTLNGGVMSWNDLTVCEHAASEIPGVKKVVNKINFINPWGIA
jgi:cytidylate kinase